MQRTTFVGLLAGAGIGAVVVAAVAFFGGAFKPNTTIGDDCRGKDCYFKIMVHCTAENICVPFVDMDITSVDRVHKLTFTIDQNTNYKFDPSDGIKFNKDNANIPCAADSSLRIYKCDPKDSPPTSHRYQIHVQGLPIVDPTIIVY